MSGLFADITIDPERTKHMVHAFHECSSAQQAEIIDRIGGSISTTRCKALAKALGQKGRKFIGELRREAGRAA